MMVKATSLLVVLLVLASPALSQLTALGRCPTVEAATDVDVLSLLGEWYEYKRYYTSFELGGKCVKATFDLADDNSTVDITTSLTSFWTRKTTTSTGTAVQSNGDGRFAVTFPKLDENSATTILVLGTDYENYAVTFSCSSFLGVFNKRFSWLLTRNPKPSSEIVNKMNAVLKNNNLSTLLYVKTLQNCNN